LTTSRKKPVLDYNIFLNRVDAVFSKVFTMLDELSIKPHVTEKETLLGHHGTCFERAERIRRTQNWKPSTSEKRLGPGVYFYQDGGTNFGMDAALTWCSKEQSGPNCPDPCVISCSICDVNVLDLTDPRNSRYLISLRDRLLSAIAGLEDELRIEFSMSSELEQRLRLSPRIVNEQFIGQRINLSAARWRSKVDVIRSFFHLSETNATYFGFVVAQRFETIRIDSIKQY
jgi:hypothetical protein